MEQEVGYLSGQIQMELKAKAALKQSTAAAVARAVTPHRLLAKYVYKKSIYVY